MQKVVLLFLLAGTTLFTVSCKQEAQGTSEPDQAPETQQATTEIAMADPAENTPSSSAYRYVTARSGLSLRAFENLQSERLARMPYGSRVEVIQPEKRPTMEVSGIRGGMDKVAFNHKTGYAFNGYLSHYFPPEPDSSFRAYASELKEHFPDVRFTRETGDRLSEPQTTETLLLPGARWHEGFFVAQELFDFPREFTFPGHAGRAREVIPDSKPKKGVWTSQLEVNRDSQGLKAILYNYKSAKFESHVRIRQVNGAVEIKRTEIIR